MILCGPWAFFFQGIGKALEDTDRSEVGLMCSVTADVAVLVLRMMWDQASAVHEGSLVLWANTHSSTRLRAGFKETWEKSREVWVIHGMSVCMCLYAEYNYFHTHLINFSLFLLWDNICCHFPCWVYQHTVALTVTALAVGNPWRTLQWMWLPLKAAQAGDSSLKAFCDENNIILTITIKFLLL